MAVLTSHKGVRSVRSVHSVPWYDLGGLPDAGHLACVGCPILTVAIVVERRAPGSATTGRLGSEVDGGERGAVDAEASALGCLIRASTMPAGDATRDIVTSYTQSAEMSGTGEIVDGTPHVHAVMAVEGDRALSGHLHAAQIGAWFARVYVIPTDG
jgi:hypothetical protein